ncbi:hypothetical protein [Allorhizocola rhizosphaerae]|uniref:hypothetical protein n=1 Tax=Allorhizocola rhizosphaerae TaxID=1872709 RepID=UPI001FE3E31D|nr:hypothetical protein [Allorhizocola rhizosphaerae]
MILSEVELSQRWVQAYGMPRGPAKFEALDYVLRHADAAGLTQHALSWRMMALTEFHHGGDPARVFLAFSQCLAAIDRDPSLQYSEHSLLWTFKWVVWALPQFPEIPLERTFAVLDDMQARYLRAGHSLHAFYQHRWLVSHHIGLSDAEEWYVRLVTAERDSLSDCRHCVPSSQVRHLATMGRDEEAIEVGAPFTSGGCTEQPQWMLSELLVPYLRTGRWEQAADAHRVGYAHMRGDRHHLDNIAQHVFFCGLSGNEVRGLELVDRHRGWLDAPSSPYAAMEFASAAALVLRRVGEADDAARMARLARDIAARFDARNGNTHQSTRIEARMAAEPLAERVALTAVGGYRRGMPKAAARLLDLVGELTAQGDPETAASTLFAAARHLHAAGQADDAIETAEEAVRALDRHALTEEALRCRALLWELYLDWTNDRERADALLDELLAAPSLPEGVPSHADMCQRAGRYVEAAAHHRQAGDRLGELRALLCALPSDDAATLAHAEAVAAGDWAPTELLAALDSFAAEALYRAGDYVGAVARTEVGLRREPGDEFSARHRLRMTAAQALVRLGRPAEAEPLARAETDDYSVAGPCVLALVLRRLGRDAEAEAVMDLYGLDEHDLYLE